MCYLQNGLEVAFGKPDDLRTLKTWDQVLVGQIFCPEFLQLKGSDKKFTSGLLFKEIR